MGNSFLLIVAGLLLFYLVVSDKWQCVEGFAGCVTGRAENQNISAPNFPTPPPRINNTVFDLGLPPNFTLTSNVGVYGF